MITNLTENERKVYAYLQKIAPKWATNTEIGEATLVLPHQQVFQITQRLMRRGLIRGEQGRYREREWVFCVAQGISAPDEIKPEAQPATGSLPEPRWSEPAGERPLSSAEFERLATQVMSRYFGTPLRHGSALGVPKEFDLVSADGSIVGDAKNFTLVRGKSPPPAKFSIIAEHVWLLENTPAKRKFLVFGNQRQVPEQWLERYGHLVENVEFYFISADGHLEKLR